MTGRRLFVFIFSGLFLSLPAQSASFELNIEPIVGYEQVQQVLPTRHSTNRIIYGGRVTAGVLIISAEAEYTHGVVTETFPALTQKDTGDRLKAGLRSGYSLGSFLRFYLRGGGQASQEQYDQTVGGVTTTTFKPLAISPYFGTGLRAALSSKIFANIDVVAVINNFSNLSENDYQTTAGFTVKLP